MKHVYFILALYFSFIALTVLMGLIGHPIPIYPVNQFITRVDIFAMMISWIMAWSFLAKLCRANGWLQ